MAQPQNFLFANTNLGPAAGDEANVYAMPAYRGSAGWTSFWKFSEEELELIRTTGGVWVNQSTNEPPPPLMVEAFAPGYCFPFADLQFFGHLAEELLNNDESWKLFGVLYYLDLAIVYLKPAINETTFRWREVRERDTLASFGRVVGELYDLECLITNGGTQTGKYYFSRPLEVLPVRLGELEKLAPLMDIHPFLTPDMVIMMEKPKSRPIVQIAEPGSGKVFELIGDKPYPRTPPGGLILPR